MQEIENENKRLENYQEVFNFIFRSMHAAILQ